MFHPRPPSLTGRLACSHWMSDRFELVIRWIQSRNRESKVSNATWETEGAQRRRCKTLGALKDDLNKIKYYYYYYDVDEDDDDDDNKEIHIAAIGLLLSLAQTLTGPKPTTVHHSMKRTTCDVRRLPHTHTTLCTKTSSQEIQRTCVSEQLTVTSGMSSSVTLLSRLPNSILYRVVEKKRGQGPPCMRHIAKATPAATYRRFSNAV